MHFIEFQMIKMTTVTFFSRTARIQQICVMYRYESKIRVTLGYQSRCARYLYVARSFKIEKYIYCIV